MATLESLPELDARIAQDRILQKRVKLLRGSTASAMQKIRARMPRQAYSDTIAKGSEHWEGNFAGKPCRRVIIYLRSSGCSWALNHRRTADSPFKAGCLDCEHSVTETTFGIPISTESYVTQFANEFEKFSFVDSPILCVYNEGNMLNEQELPARARNRIVDIIAGDEHIKRLVIESLPEYIRPETLTDIRSALGDRELEIGIGLESANELVRSLCVNKSYSLRDFELALKMIRPCAVRALAYVLFKPSFLTEAEAIEDSIRAIRYAFAAGVDAVSIEPVNISNYNMAGWLNRLGFHRRPWLWSVLEVVKATAQLGEVRIGGYQFAPKYLWYAENCGVCDQAVQDAMVEFNKTYDLSAFDGLTCSCISEWKAELVKPTLQFLERIETINEKLHSVLDQRQRE